MVKRVPLNDSILKPKLFCRVTLFNLKFKTPFDKIFHSGMVKSFHGGGFVNGKDQLIFIFRVRLVFHNGFLLFIESIDLHIVLISLYEMFEIKRV